MRKPVTDATTMAMAGRLARPWCSRDAVAGHIEHLRQGGADGFGASQLQVGNGIVRSEGLRGGSG